MNKKITKIVFLAILGLVAAYFVVTRVLTESPEDKQWREQYEANQKARESGQAPAATAPATGGWDKFRKTEVGTIEFKTAGPHVVKVRAADAASWKAINLAEVKLTP